MYLFIRWRQCPDLTVFAGDRLSVPEMRGCGMMWVALWGVGLGR